MPVKRRTLLGLLSSGTFLVSAGALGRTIPTGAVPLNFPQGVASGDPQADGVMLWTRAVPAHEQQSTTAPVQLQLSPDPDFAQLVLDTSLNASRDNDYTVRVYVNDLEADTFYFYRFLGAGGSASITGRTRTAPAPDQEREARLAFASCQSYEQGHYGNWARMLADDHSRPEEEQIDFVLHLGDFIYERTWPQLADGRPVPRPLPPFPDGGHSGKNSWAVTLADYRHLYKTYLSDPHLQAARARWPFICTWDDHEFSNDNFRNYSTYEDTPREESARKVASNRAWFEYIPTVLQELDDQPAHDFQDPGEAPSQSKTLDSLCIYRRLQWGKNLDIVLTDSRSYRTPACLPNGLAESIGLPLDSVELVEIADAGKAYNNGDVPRVLPYGDRTTTNPGADRDPGSMLGEEQRGWFLTQMSESTARWKLWGNALPILPMRIDLGSLPFTDYEHSIFHLDAWAGYPYEQSLLMRELHQARVNGLVSFSGDHHMHGAGTVKHNPDDENAPALAVDFSVAGISSTPMFMELYEQSRKSHPDFAALVARKGEDGITPVWNMTLLDGVLASMAYSKTGLQGAARWLGPNRANPGLKYMDSTANGYGLARFTSNTLKVNMVTINDIQEPFSTPPAIKYSANFEVPLWDADSSPQLQGPEFDGGAPFPFTPPSV